MDNNGEPDVTAALIASSKRLIEEVEQTIARSRKFFAEHGLDPASCHEYFEQAGLDPKMAPVRQQLEEALRQAAAGMHLAEEKPQHAHRAAVRRGTV